MLEVEGKSLTSSKRSPRNCPDANDQQMIVLLSCQQVLRIITNAYVFAIHRILHKVKDRIDKLCNSLALGIVHGSRHANGSLGEYIASFANSVLDTFIFMSFLWPSSYVYV